MRKTTFAKIYLSMIFALVIFYIREAMWIYSKLEIEHSHMRNYLQLLAVFLVAAFVFFNLKQRIRIDKLGVFFLLWTFGCIMNLIVAPYSDVTYSLLASAVNFLYVCCVFIFFFVLFSKSDVFLFFVNKLVIVALIVFAYIYLQTYSMMTIIIAEDMVITSNSYYVLIMLPFVLLINNKILKFLLILTIAVCSIMATKRGGIIAFMVAMIAYYVVEHIFIKKSKYMLRNIFIFLFSMAVLFAGFYFFDQRYNSGYLVERLDRMEEDEGSGRIRVYEEVYKGIKNSTATTFLFGHGFYTTTEVTSKRNTAHNDFLEVLYDYGFFMFLLYLWLHIFLLRYSIRLIWQKSPFAAPMVVSCSIFFVFSMVSHVIIYPNFSVFAMFWGMLLGVINKNKKASLYENRNFNVS